MFLHRLRVSKKRKNQKPSSVNSIDPLLCVARVTSQLFWFEPQIDFVFGCHRAITSMDDVSTNAKQHSDAIKANSRAIQNQSKNITSNNAQYPEKKYHRKQYMWIRCIPNLTHNILMLNLHQILHFLGFFRVFFSRQSFYV